MIFAAYGLNDRYEIEDEKLIPESISEALEKEYHCPVIEISLRSNKNIEMPFHKLIQNVLGFYDVYDSHDKEYDLLLFINLVNSIREKGALTDKFDFVSNNVSCYIYKTNNS